jgi:uncharacterized membrane protein
MPIYLKLVSCWRIISQKIKRERKTYLVGNVRPVMLAAQILKVLLQESTHLNDAVGHALDLTQPLLVKLGIVQDSRGNTSTVDGRVRVQSADEDLQLGIDTLLLLGRSTDKRECANTLTVETLRLSVT